MKPEHFKKNSEVSSVVHKHDTLALEESYQSSKMVYDLKKEVLDKLDIILQRVNLEVIAAMEQCNVSDFKLISMSELEPEISDLFIRLDNCVQRRERSMRLYDNNSMTFSNGSLIKQNEQLKTQIQSLNHYINELQAATKPSQTSNVQQLKKEVETLNSQIEKYEKMWRNVDLNPKHFDSQRLKRMYMKADRVMTEVIKLKQLCVQIVKALKQHSEFMTGFISQSMQKIASVFNDSRYHNSALLSQNSLLKSEIQNWQYDLEHYIQPKLLAILGSNH